MGLLVSSTLDLLSSVTLTSGAVVAPGAAVVSDAAAAATDSASNNADYRSASIIKESKTNTSSQGDIENQIENNEEANSDYDEDNEDNSDDIAESIMLNQLRKRFIEDQQASKVRQVYRNVSELFSFITIVVIFLRCLYLSVCLIVFYVIKISILC